MELPRWQPSFHAEGMLTSPTQSNYVTSKRATFRCGPQSGYEPLTRFPRAQLSSSSTSASASLRASLSALEDWHGGAPQEQGPKVRGGSV